jgi:hypothetical protein
MSVLRRVRSRACRTRRAAVGGIAALMLLGGCTAAQDGAAPYDDGGWLIPADEGSTTLVRGRITADTLILEPLVILRQVPPTSPTGDQHHLLGIGEGGDTLVDVRFDGEPVAAGGGDLHEHHFSFSLDSHGGRELQAVEIHLADGRSLRRDAGLTSREMMDILSAPGALVVERSTPGRVTVRWDADQFPAAVILDPAPGRILAFVLGGEITLTTDADSLDIVISEGVRSVSRRVPVPR